MLVTQRVKYLGDFVTAFFYPSYKERVLGGSQINLTMFGGWGVGKLWVGIFEGLFAFFNFLATRLMDDLGLSVLVSPSAKRG